MPSAKACCLAILLTAVSPPSPPAAQSSITPVTASIVVRLQTNTATYHVGEEIPLELEFRGTGDKDYYFSTAACGFFGRFSTEQLAVTPSDGVEDPLADFFSSAGYGGSCLSSWHPLDGTPFVIRVSMNDSVRITRPGAYRLVVTSTRLQRYSLQPAPALASAPVDLTIAPIDTAWAAAETIRACDLIDRAVPADVKHGAAILRALGTDAAALALVERYAAIAKADASEIAAALISSPYRALVIQQMEARVESGADLDATYLTTLTRLRVLQEPPAPRDAVARDERSTRVQAEYDARWRAALARRPATAATLGTELARFVANASPELQQQIADDLDQHPAEAAAALVALPPDTRSAVLRSTTGWTYLRRPWILPALRRIYAQGQGNPTAVAEADLALKGLYELAPAEGRRLILDELSTGERRIGYDALAILPDAQLPDLDAVLQARYATARVTDPAARAADRGTTAWLMARYGSPDLLPFVAGLLERRGPECVVEGAALVYLFKHDPAAAMNRLDPSLDRAARGGCASPLSALAARYWSDRVESAAMAELMDADVRRVMDGAEVLGRRGSRAAKQPLLDRLTQWSVEWQGRAAELVVRGPDRPYPSPDLIENDIVRALFQNTTFALTGNDVATIRTLCVTDSCRASVDGQARDIKTAVSR